MENKMNKDIYDLNKEYEVENHLYASEIYFENELLCKSYNIFNMFDLIEYNGIEYIITRLQCNRAENDKVYIQLLEEYEKNNIIINKLEINYETLKYLEEILIENYGYKLVKIEDDKNE